MYYFHRHSAWSRSIYYVVTTTRSPVVANWSRVRTCSRFRSQTISL